jgi:hypothetical protein
VVSSPRALAIYAGREAARLLARDGWNPDLFTLLLGASGGPKWFVLSQLDRVLFGDFLQRGTRPLAAVGSSIGAWRHACLTASDPAAAIARLEQGYLYQRFEARPDPRQVSAVSLETLRDALGEDGATRLVEHPRIGTAIVTARGRGPASGRSGPLLVTGMGSAALGNALNRRLLAPHFQRVVFQGGQVAPPALAWEDFDTARVRLDTGNLVQALHATASIPFVLTGEQDIPGGPPGQYWDGGIVDYHFDLRQYRGEGLILYPHFSTRVVPGWFDKFLPWRAARIAEAERLVLLCPRPDFVASLPLGKIPDRGDFTRLSNDARIACWQTCVDRAAVLAEEFMALVEGDDPLRGVQVPGD